MQTRIKTHNAISKTQHFSQFILMVFFGVFATSIQAQLFVEIPKSGTPMVNADAAWIMSQNKLHPLAAGQLAGTNNTIRTVFHQQRSFNSFVSKATALPDIALGGMDVGDINNDGREDVVITGASNGGKLQSGVYFQQANGTFSRSQLVVPALTDGSVQLGDYDKDGDLDVLITGLDCDNHLKTLVLRNDKDKLTDIQANLPGVRFGKAIWADFSNNGKLDIVITGKSAEGLITRLFIQKNDQFSGSRAHFTPLYHSDAVSADFNGDGYADLMIAGQNKDGNPVTRYYINNKNHQFAEGNRGGIRQLMNASLDAGDFDGDGFVDVVITGESLERPYTIVLKNISGKGFKDVMAGLPGLSNGTARWGDFDNDGDLDLYIAGVDVCFNFIGSVYRCNLNPARTTEEEPMLLSTYDMTKGPKYYFVFSSCYCDPENTGTKAYHGFVSNIHQEKKDFDLNYEFNHLLITQYPGWNKADRGHRTSNAFVSVTDAEQGRKTVIASYLQDNYTVHYLNW